jgi:hypothetical protein
MLYENNLYDIVKSYFGDNLYITGSVALRMILYTAGYDDLLETLSNPNDIDFLYTGRQTEECRITRIGSYVNPKEPHRSVTFVCENTENCDYNTFDLTMVPSVKHIVIDGINVIDPRSLLKYYQDDDINENTRVNVEALKEAIKRVEQDDELSQRLFYRPKQTHRKDFGSLSRALF